MKDVWKLCIWHRFTINGEKCSRSYMISHDYLLFNLIFFFRCYFYIEDLISRYVWAWPNSLIRLEIFENKHLKKKKKKIVRLIYLNIIFKHVNLKRAKGEGEREIKILVEWRHKINVLCVWLISFQLWRAKTQKPS